MTIHHDIDRGTVEQLDAPFRWKASAAAVRRVEGRELGWKNPRPRQSWVVQAMDQRGTEVVAVLRRHANHNRWSVNIEGFEFWQYVHVLDRETWTTPMGFDRARDAHRFVVRVLREAGACIVMP
jgi:hypothetical protein